MTRVKSANSKNSFIRAGKVLLERGKNNVYNKNGSTNSESINYQKRVFLPNNGSMTPILLANSQTSVSFDLPAQCFNLSRSKLVFSLVCTPTTRGVCLNACPTSFWDRVVLSTRSGLMLLDLPSARFYGKMVSPATTSMEEFAGRSSGCSMMAAATTVTAYATATPSRG